MKRVDYICDICDEILARDDDKKCEFISFAFSTADSSKMRFLVKSPENADIHVCIPCMRGIHWLYTDQMNERE